jgi:3'(2'), 5'-bisphosphate nucleotidase
MSDLLQAVEAIARAAGQAIMAVYASDFAVLGKPDASPLTEADLRAEAIITPALQALLPAAPVVAEEAHARGECSGSDAAAGRGGAAFWLVDPLDGTREFVARNGEFTVNIALVVGGEPVLGVVYAPALGRLYAGERGGGAWLDDAAGRRAIRCRGVPEEGITVATSRVHGDRAAVDALLQGQRVARHLTAGSSLKFGLLASGLADVYPRYGRTMEWDTAAGHAVLAAAGGSVCDTAGQPLRYGKPGFENPHFIARGRA